MVNPRLLVAAGILATLGGFTPTSASQTPLAPAFDTASIKLNPGFRGLATSFVIETADFQSNGRFVAVNASLLTLAYAAYPAVQVQGVPRWPDRFDIDAFAHGDPREGEIEQMLRTLLTDRFALRAHQVTQQLSGYKLVMARADRKLGPQLRPSSGVAHFARPQGLSLTMTAATMDELAIKLSRVLHTTVFNQTGLDGTFDVDVDLGAMNELSPIPDVLPAQLGLKLDSTKGQTLPVDVLVIDGAERPRGN